MNKRLLIGLMLLAAAAGVVALWQSLPHPQPVQQITVHGYVGSEKVGLLRNPQVIRILRQRYGLTVDHTSMGSIEQVRTDTAGKDFLWPSNEVALEIYKESHPGKVKAETVFNSPIVLYSWEPVTEALVRQGIVEKAESTYYAVDMPKLIELITSGKEWKDIGLPQLYGKVSVISTDPTKSNSGNMFYGLLVNLLNNGQVADDQAVERLLPTIRAYYESLGYLEQGSGDLFKRFVRTGMGDKPLIAGYENQLVEFSLENEANREQILAQIRILYPRPTVWSSHPLIALTPNGEVLLKAMQDTDIQRIAWEQHGFRSGLVGIQNDPKILNVVGIPATVTSVMPLPRPSAMERLIQGLLQ
ncbi:MAG: hypothetical protein ACUVX9_09510 [Anaerolineae bacterium]